jgi:hypothetical protein
MITPWNGSGTDSELNTTHLRGCQEDRRQRQILEGIGWIPSDTSEGVL